jgi:hypothetical protein
MIEGKATPKNLDIKIRNHDHYLLLGKVSAWPHSI